MTKPVQKEPAITAELPTGDQPSTVPSGVPSLTLGFLKLTDKEQQVFWWEQIQVNLSQRGIRIGKVDL